MPNSEYGSAFRNVVTGSSLLLAVLLLYWVGRLESAITSMQSELTTLRSELNSPTSPKDLGAAVADAVREHKAAEMAARVSEKYEPYQGAPETVPNDNRIYGPLDARFTLVVYSDLECPYCKKFHSTPKKVVDHANGLVNWQWKHMPLNFHNPAAALEAQGAECVADQKGNRGFWVFLEEVFAMSNGNGAGVPDLADLAENVGVDRAAFKQCMSAGTFAGRVQEQVQRGESLGVQGTPATFVVDNQTGKTQAVSGAQPEQALVAVIKRMIAEEQEVAAD